MHPKFPIMASLMACLLNISSVDGQFNMSEYYKMPKLYLMDDYDRCLDEYNASTYCIASSIIKPNATSALWEYIEKFSSNKKKHFRHDRLQRGICINLCQELMDHFDPEEQMSYFQEEFPTDNEVWLDPRIFRKATHYRKLYDQLINQCINHELITGYDLVAFSQVEYCVTNHEILEYDFLDICFFFVLVSLVTTVFASTYLDRRLKKTRPVEEQTSDHYRMPLQGPVNGRVTFSLLRNWYRLMSGPKTNSDKDLRCIHAMRFLTMFCVIIGHTILFLNVFPVFNPQYIEMNYYRFITMILINGHTVIQTYFAISGFLLSVQFMDYKESQKVFHMSYFFKAIFYRYVRLTPVYAFMILFHATLLIDVQSGPLWKHVAETERSFCRSNWWTNLLYVNNYVHVGEPCLQHGWYLATDFQMFIIGVTLHMIMWRFPKSTKLLLSISVFISYVIPGVVTYKNKFEGVVIIRPESQKYGMWFDDVYKKIYIPTHTNSGTYLAGMVAGLLYNKLKKKDLNLRQNRAFIWAWYAIVPTGALLLLSAYWFYACTMDKPAFWIAIYAAIMKNLWGVLGGVMIIGSAFGVGWVARDFLCNPIFRPLGRITFCVYLCHPFILRATMGNVRQPVFLSDSTIVVYVSSTLILSYLGGALLCIVLELPISAIQKQMLNRNKVDPSFTDNTIELVHNT
ncbi:nose resistant to fluoxetine protein 6-like isoform X1 [Phlebotomus papatasi]|nr:nose resistant to fluoxetine protein 6-like isoform X1 [Phlebotomus papatasi]